MAVREKNANQRFGELKNINKQASKKEAIKKKFTPCAVKPN